MNPETATDTAAARAALDAIAAEFQTILERRLPILAVQAWEISALRDGLAGDVGRMLQPLLDQRTTDAATIARLETGVRQALAVLDWTIGVYVTMRDGRPCDVCDDGTCLDCAIYRARDALRALATPALPAASEEPHGR